VPATSAAMKFSATTMEATATMETYGAVKSSAWLESMSSGSWNSLKRWRWP
jgi:hypothetical protein